MRIRNGKIQIRDGKIFIRDKHFESATLHARIVSTGLFVSMSGLARIQTRNANIEISEFFFLLHLPVPDKILFLVNLSSALGTGSATPGME
jgi:hypothetical protein